MKRVLVAAFALAYLISYSPAFAASGHGGGVRGMGGITRGARVPPPPSVPNMQGRIPSATPAPARPPVVNGPVGPSGLPPMGNGL
jgi:hypothetical protein